MSQKEPAACGKDSIGQSAARIVNQIFRDEEETFPGGASTVDVDAADVKPDSDSSDLEGDKVLRAISKVGEFRNWAATVQTAPAKVLRPKSTKDVLKALKKARGMENPPTIRCMGSSHSWTPLFADDGAWLMDTSGIKHIVWSATDNPTQVTIGPGVTCGELATFCDSKDRGEWRGMFLPSDVILETVTYGGVVNSACHGTGKTQTVCDYVVKTSIIKWDGTRVDLSREADPEGFAKSIAHFGLLGVTVSLTFQLDAARTAVRVTDHKCRAREIFLERGQLPGTGEGANPLLDLWNNNYAVEIFYFAASSLEITDILSKEFEDQTWDEYNDICSIKTFNRTDKAVGKDDDSFFGINQKTSTRFDRNFSITDFLKINLGTEVALPLVAKFGDKPTLVSLYSKAAALALEPAFKTSGEVSYETSLGQAIHWQKYITTGYPVSDTEVCIKCDPDFTNAYKAVQDTIAIVKFFAEEEDTMPLNVAIEMRFTKHSDSPICPAFGKEGDVFLWVEVLSAVGTPRLKDFNTKVADAWLAIKLKDGSNATLPHWAKWSESYIADAEAKLKNAYADRLPLLRSLSAEWDPNGMFMNSFFARLFSPAG
eukprot:jgi/Undpi1/12315/HiC_scaffold_5.g01991.m1